MHAITKYLAFATSAVICLAASLPAWALSGQRTIIYKSGRVQQTSYIAGSKAAVCSNPEVAFAFDAVAAGGTGGRVNIGQRGDVVIAVDGCAASGVEGSVRLTYGLIGKSGTPAIVGTDFTGSAAQTVDLEFPPTPQGPTQRTFAFSIPSTATAGRRFGPAMTSGSFQLLSPIISAGNLPVVTDTLPNIEIRNVPIGGVVVPPTNLDSNTLITVAAAVANVCAGSSDPVCLATQNAANAGSAGVAVVENNLVEITPTETTGIQNSVNQIGALQSLSVLGRMRTLLEKGGGGISVNAGLHGAPFTLEDVLTSANSADESAREIGGQKLGFWANASFGGGDYDKSGAEAAFDFDNWALTVGLDYMFSDRTFGGVGYGFSRMDSDFDRDEGRLDADADVFHVYFGTERSTGNPDHRWSLLTSAAATRGTYNQLRVQNFQQLQNGAAIDLGQSTAKSTVDFDQISAAVNIAYSISKDKWTFQPEAQFEFISSDVDGFRERGDSNFLLEVDEQHLVTRSYSAGVYLDYANATDMGTFRPYLRGLAYSDSGTSSYAIIARFTDPTCQPNSTACQIAVFVDEPDRQYATAEIGVGFIRPLGDRVFNFNVGYMELFSFDGVDRWGVRMDARFQF